MSSGNPVYLYARLRKFFYDLKFIKSVELRTPVVSVGNILFGGSGKTPFVSFLLDQFSDLEIAVVCQSYLGASQTASKVDLTLKNAVKIFGDEACLLKQWHPDVDVWCGPQKFRAALVADYHKKYDLMIVDDGFTHHQIQKNLNLVLLDCSRSLKEYRLPPFGHLREDLSALERADLFVLTKGTNEETIIEMDRLAKKYDKPIGNAVYTMSLPIIDDTQKYYFFAGIGNFEYLKNFLIEKQIQIVRFEKMSNHKNYSHRIQKEILNFLVKNELRALTTEKDFVKIDLQELRARIDCIKVKVELEPSLEILIEQKIRLLV